MLFVHKTHDLVTILIDPSPLPEMRHVDWILAVLYGVSVTINFLDDSSSPWPCFGTGARKVSWVSFSTTAKTTSSLPLFAGGPAGGPRVGSIFTTLALLLSQESTRSQKQAGLT